MVWEDVKEKILVFGEDDYVFADMFISIINSYTQVNNKEDLRYFTFLMLEELMEQNLILIFTLYNDSKGVTQLEKYDYKDDKSRRELIDKINHEWKIINYDLPQPNQLFWITADLSL